MMLLSSLLSISAAIEVATALPLSVTPSVSMIVLPLSAQQIVRADRFYHFDLKHYEHTIAFRILFIYFLYGFD